MDATLIWMLILAGAIVALLGAFLAVSEKELRKKRQELASLATKLSRGPTATVGTDSENNILKLERTNKDLQEQLSSMSGRLESTERELAESESGRSHLKNVDTEKRQLEISNQKLNDELADLRQQMNSALKRTDDSRFERAAYDEQLAKMASELNYAMEKLEQSETRIKELVSATDPSALSSAERSLTESRIEFEKNIKSLERELADSHEKLQAFDRVNRQLLDVEQRHEKVLLENRQLQQEITRWQERLADSEEAQRRLGIIRQQMDARSRGEIPDHQSQKQLENCVELLESQPSSRQAVQPGISLRSTASAGPSSMDGSEYIYGQAAGLDSVREYLELRRQNNEITGVNTDLRQSPDNRTAQLSNLLTSIRLHGSNPYEEQIDSLKDFTDLSETERHVIRDIFLARADEVQKRGRDEEMLRYRSWAKSIVYHTSFGIEETQDLAEHQAPENNRNFAKSSELTTIDTTPTQAADAMASNTEPASVPPGGIMSPARNVALGMGIGLALVLILIVQLFFGTSSEITVAADDPSTPPIFPADVIPNKQHSLETSRPTPSDGNLAQVEAVPPEGRLRPRADDVKTGVRNTAKEKGATANRSQNVWGAYTIVKPTPVFSEPSEDSAFITSLDPGTQVNVVAARQGWYEIRSKTGRPPGFIRQEAGSRNR